MQEGSLRCDVNISLRREGSDAFGTRTEIKNLNSFTSVAAAIEYEYKRQLKILDCGGKIVQETRGWNADTGKTISRRGKEDANDYRYFPEPDIGDIYVSDEEIEQFRKMLPELPDKRLERYISELGVPQADAKLLSKYNKVSEYFETACKGVRAPKTVASIMVMQMFALITTEVERENWSPKTTAGQLSELVRMLESGKLSRNIAKRVFAQMLETGSDAKGFISEDDIGEFSEDTLKALCHEAIQQNQKTVADYRAGKDRAIRALVGTVMRDSKGRADAIEAEAMLKVMLV